MPSTIPDDPSLVLGKLVHPKKLDLLKERHGVNKQVADAAKVSSEKGIQPLKASIRGISDEIESPIGHNHSDIKALPISADSLKINMQYFADDDGAKSMAALRKLRNSKVTAALSAVADIDSHSMMDALDNYVQKCLAGNIGVPINDDLKPITRSQPAPMWVARYVPGKYLAISGDDSAPAPAPAPATH